MAPPRANLARLATTRNALGPLSSADVTEKEATHFDGSIKKPIVVGEDDATELSPPDFSVSDRKLHAPHRHSKHHPHHHYLHHPTSTPSTTEKSRKRNRPSKGNRRSDLYDEVRFQLAEDQQQDVEMLDLVSDEDDVSISPAAAQASAMLRRHNGASPCKEAQPPASLPLRETSRVPVMKNEGKKRFCSSGSFGAGQNLQVTYAGV